LRVQLVRQDLFFGSHDFFLLRDLNFADGAAGATAALIPSNALSSHEGRSRKSKFFWK